jgi:hypothetical protein
METSTGGPTGPINAVYEIGSYEMGLDKPIFLAVRYSWKSAWDTLDDFRRYWKYVYIKADRNLRRLK